MPIRFCRVSFANPSAKAGACRRTNLLAEIECFSGNADTAAALAHRALGDVHIPPLDQDQTLLASVLQNNGLVSEATGDWATALDRQQQALAIRREAEDARGAAWSLHGIGQAYCGLGRPDDAEQASGRIEMELDGSVGSMHAESLTVDGRGHG